MHKAADVCVADERLCSELGQITRAHGAAAGAGSAPSVDQDGNPALPRRN